MISTETLNDHAVVQIRDSLETVFKDMIRVEFSPFFNHAFTSSNFGLFLPTLKQPDSSIHEMLSGKILAGTKCHTYEQNITLEPDFYILESYISDNDHTQKPQSGSWEYDAGRLQLSLDTFSSKNERHEMVVETRMVQKYNILEISLLNKIGQIAPFDCEEYYLSVPIAK